MSKENVEQTKAVDVNPPRGEDKHLQLKSLVRMNKKSAEIREIPDFADF
jgi:hypothetical protein